VLIVPRQSALAATWHDATAATADAPATGANAEAAAAG